MKKAWFLIVSVQLVVIVFLVRNIFHKKQVLGTVNVNPIKEESVVFPEDTNLNHFYEPKPDEVVREQPEWLDYEAVYTFNSDGLNETRNYEIEKPENTFRIITVGDSHTFGAYVNTKDNYPEQLESMLNNLNCSYKFGVINLGVEGYDPEYDLERFKIRGMKYKPDLILYLVTWNDLFPNELYFPLEEEIADEASISGKIEEYQNEYGIWYASQMAWEQLSETYGEEYLVTNMTNKIIELIDLYEGKVVLSTYKDERKIIRNTLVSLSDTYPHVFLHYNVNNSDMEKLPDGHPTKEDYTKHAESFIQFFLDKNLIKCS